MTDTTCARRQVLPWSNLDNAQADYTLRGNVILVDLHGLWWTVPTEITVGDMLAQMSAVLLDNDLAVFPGADPARVHRQDWPR